MTEKTKDLIRSIVVTLAAIVCVIMLIPGTIYIGIMNSAAPMLTVVWGLICLFGSIVFGWGAYTCWKEYKIHYKNK